MERKRSVVSLCCGKPDYPKVSFSGFISEPMRINMLRVPETSSGWQMLISTTETNYKRTYKSTDSTDR